MTLARDFFIKTLDDSASGIQGVMARLRERLEEVDHVSANVLDDQVTQCTTEVKRFRTSGERDWLFPGRGRPYIII